MKTKLRELTQDEKNAISTAVRLHGKKAKQAIRSAWYNGRYWDQGLGEYSGTLQSMRNSADGFDLLEQVRLNDYK